ncbi:hypothetical protein TRIATDRAFT_316294 [Trichoderma atroviride IMI 206040]|uniref:Uncharacterized protein n=1 Tax=Hypocrea atroviridis (strain ATCC 20476 / IMI 206040) TaxID=452589 RepID=G9NMR1_HYPAI|nr:uncharacterized protein TRIATDRAFT_316294 [Trichoderma atroviride IMI 206040]EHK48191.1 hypothetical protein TRIATDRAFT_316294 [Trichoderma atroviride IMI 206040]
MAGDDLPNARGLLVCRRRKGFASTVRRHKDNPGPPTRRSKRANERNDFELTK